MYVTWNAVGNDGVCLCSARVATSNEQTHARHIQSGSRHSLGDALFLTYSIMNYNFPNNRLCLVPVVLIIKRMVVLHNFDSSQLVEVLHKLHFSVQYKPHLECINSNYIFSVIKILKGKCL